MEIESRFFNVDNEFLNFVELVSESEGFGEWKLIIWHIEDENECHNDLKWIYLWNYSELEVLKAVFLHEIAHGITNSGHDEGWKMCLDYLLNEYMPDISKRNLDFW